MGFLDHSTKNIIIDAVLTDKGRELLAKNNGSFTISHYAFGDDEVDYTIIKKFGRTVGKEKIEKNTPVFEAQTLGQNGLKYCLTSYSDPSLTVLPYFTFTPATVGEVTTDSSTGLQSITIEQNVNSGALTAAQRALVQETTYQIVMDSRFIDMRNTSVTPRTEPYGTNVIYELAASSISNNPLSTVSFTIGASSAGKTLTQFHDSASNVKTVIRVLGVSTGVSLQIPITVNYSA